MQANLVSSRIIGVEYDLLSVQQLTPKVDTDFICDRGFIAFASLSRSSAATNLKQDGDRTENNLCVRTGCALFLLISCRVTLLGT